MSLKFPNSVLPSAWSKTPVVWLLFHCRSKMVQCLNVNMVLSEWNSLSACRCFLWMHQVLSTLQNIHWKLTLPLHKCGLKPGRICFYSPWPCDRLVTCPECTPPLALRFPRYTAVFLWPLTGHCLYKRWADDWKCLWIRWSVPDQHDYHGTRPGQPLVFPQQASGQCSLLLPSLCFKNSHCMIWTAMCVHTCIPHLSTLINKYFLWQNYF